MNRRIAIQMLDDTRRYYGITDEGSSGWCDGADGRASWPSDLPLRWCVGLPLALPDARGRRASLALPVGARSPTIGAVRRSSRPRIDSTAARLYARPALV